MTAFKGRYLSVLRTKQGEIQAVQKLSSRIWAAWNPLFDFAAPDGADGAEVLAGVATDILKCLRGGTAFFSLDRLNLVDLSDVDKFFGTVRANVVALPVFSPRTASRLAIKLRQHANDGFVLRLGVDQFVDTRLNDLLSNFLATHDLEPAAGHIVFDFGGLTTTGIALCFHALAGLGQMDFLKDWASLTVVGSGAPTETITKDVVHLVERLELRLWRSAILHDQLRIDLGDYTVSNPSSPDRFIPGMKVPVKLAYTIEKYWLYQRGEAPPTGSWDAMHDIAKRIVDHDEYKGQHYSYGDDWIWRVAHGSDVEGPGNPTTWKKVATNHHITFAADQVARLCGP